jgi:hypothetical protein
VALQLDADDTGSHRYVRQNEWSDANHNIIEQDLSPFGERRYLKRTAEW